jgi:hypothetical protein
MTDRGGGHDASRHGLCLLGFDKVKNIGFSMAVLSRIKAIARLNTAFY